MKPDVQNAVQLYRYVLRCIKKFPEDNQSFYKHQVRQMYKSYGDETDPERIKQIIDRSLSDVEWLLNKYTKK